MTSPDLFHGAWALVTGASSGIGEGFARQLAARGAHLVLTARSAARLEELAAALVAEHPVEVRVVPGDLARPGGARELTAEVEALGVPVEHLVNNAGFGAVGPFARADAEVLTEMVRVNCEALTVLSRHFLPAMIERRAGGVIHVASVAGFMPMPYTAVYAATKAYVLSLSTALAAEVRPAGVRVLALCPGPVPTGFQARSGARRPSNPVGAAVLSVEETVRRGLEAYARGRDVCVPGAVNRATALAMGLLPPPVAARATARFARRAGRAG